MESNEASADLPSRRVREQWLWIGPEDGPIFARLTIPEADTSRGGVVLSPSTFRDARASRRTLRWLAAALASDGFAVLWFDQFGVGDSSGNPGDDALADRWGEQVRSAVELLRSLGAQSVSAVGYRLGATISASECAKSSLNLKSVVLWDPCESGRSYLREMNAFEMLRRASHDATSTIATSEFVLDEKASAEIRLLDLLEATPDNSRHEEILSSLAMTDRFQTE